MVFYESRKLNEHEHNYVTHELELVTIVHALKMWRHYLFGRIFVLLSDHSGLRYFFTNLMKIPGNLYVWAPLVRLILRSDTSKVKRIGLQMLLVGKYM